MFPRNGSTSDSLQTPHCFSLQENGMRPQHRLACNVMSSKADVDTVLVIPALTRQDETDVRIHCIAVCCFEKRDCFARLQRYHDATNGGANGDCGGIVLCSRSCHSCSRPNFKSMREASDDYIHRVQTRRVVKSRQFANCFGRANFELFEELHDC